MREYSLETIYRDLDGDLDPEESRKLALRLDQDPELRRLYDQTRQMFAALASPDELDLPEGLRSRIRSIPGAEEFGQQRRPALALTWLPWAAMLAAGVALGVLLSSVAPKESPGQAIEPLQLVGTMAGRAGTEFYSWESTEANTFVSIQKVEAGKSARLEISVRGGIPLQIMLTATTPETTFTAVVPPRGLGGEIRSSENRVQIDSRSDGIFSVLIEGTPGKRFIEVQLLLESRVLDERVVGL